MKITSHLLSLALVAAPALAAAQSTQPHELAWMQGCWAAVNQDRAVEEQWMAPRGKTMIGTSRTVEGASLVTYEFMMIRQNGDHLVFEVRPSGRAPVLFNASTVTASSVVFENAKHSFPQKIGYQRNGDNEIVAWIEGDRHGQTRRVEFPYHQVVCAGS